MKSILNKTFDYPEAFVYSKNECPMEIEYSGKKCIRFEVTRGIAYFYWYWYKTGKIEAIEKDELREMYPFGYTYESFKIATQFAKIITRPAKEA